MNKKLKLAEKKMLVLNVARTILPMTYLLKTSLFSNNVIATTNNNLSIIDLQIQIEQLDVYYLLRLAEKIHETFVVEAKNCLKALIEQFEKLFGWYQKSWVFGSYRLGNISFLAKDIAVWSAKLARRLQLIHLATFGFD